MTEADYEPAYDMLTLLVDENYHAADRVAASWIDQGNADLLIESLADTAHRLLEELAGLADVDTETVWQRFLLHESRSQ